MIDHHENCDECIRPEFVMASGDHGSPNPERPLSLRFIIFDAIERAGG